MAIKLMELFATENIDKCVIPTHFVCSARMMLCCRNYISLVNLIALYYQIRDDYMNLQSEEVSLYSYV